MLAVISDIHGNRWALEAVLQDIEDRGVHQVVNLGDVFYGPLDPDGTYDLLAGRDYPTVRGNEDRVLWERCDPGGIEPTRAFVVDRLDKEAMDFIRALPVSLVLESGVHLFHGTPSRDHVYLTEQVGPDGVGIRTRETLDRLLTKTPESLVLCGHSHLPRIVQRSPHQIIVNPGSVGLQAFTDDRPFPHTMETGSPLARYAVVHREGLHCRVEHIALPYDCQAAADAARRNGRADWAHWLETGRA